MRVERSDAQPHDYDIDYEKRGRVSHRDVHGRAWIAWQKVYSQAHKPVAQQDVAVEHAVRILRARAAAPRNWRCTRPSGATWWRGRLRRSG
ncbi:hypothetical protein PT2222_110027 [Paraburkholderia tropica]